MHKTRSEDRPRSVAVVGCGYWGVNYLRLLGEMPGVESVYAVEEDEARRATGFPASNSLPRSMPSPTASTPRSSPRRR